MHSTSGAWKEYSFQPRWRCCCERIWPARASSHWNAPSKAGLAGDLAADVADDATEPRAQNAQLPTMAVELLDVGIAPSHHRRMPRFLSGF
jgi:hypothetical protein